MSPSVDMPKDVLVCVPPEKVAAIWPHVSAFIGSAFQNGRGDDTPEVVKADLEAPRSKRSKRPQSLLWVVWDGSGLLCAATTKIMQTPRRKVCVVTSCGGREMPRWVAFINDLADYAKKEGCDVLRVEGREGWKAVLPNFRQPYIVLERAL